MHVWDCNLPVIACMQLYTRKRTYPRVEQLFDLQNICILLIVFELCVREKKEGRRRKLKFPHSVFLTLRKVSWTVCVHFAREQQSISVCKCYALLSCGFRGAAPIPYVQDSILNLAHCYIRSTTLLYYLILVQEKCTVLTPLYFLYFYSTVLLDPLFRKNAQYLKHTTKPLLCSTIYMHQGRWKHSLIGPAHCKLCRNNYTLMWVWFCFIAFMHVCMK